MRGPIGLAPGLAEPGRCLVMGILNVTPDSFSDGGRWNRADAAIDHGLALVAAGADLIDVGGESTRPGAERIDTHEELRRVLPVVKELANAGVAVSIDTMRARVAEAALGAGAVMINDVSGGLADRDMVPAAAQSGAPYVLMHWRGHSDVMDALAQYRDVTDEVSTELLRRRDALIDAGMHPQAIVLDPGFGFAKRPEHSWRLLADLSRLAQLGHPLLVGTSRKRFLAQAVPGGDSGPADRDDGTAATTVLAAQAGAWAVRVHDAAASASAVRVVAACQEARTGVRGDG